MAIHRIRVYLESTGTFYFYSHFFTFSLEDWFDRVEGPRRLIIATVLNSCLILPKRLFSIKLSCNKGSVLWKSHWLLEIQPRSATHLHILGSIHKTWRGLIILIIRNQDVPPHYEPHRLQDLIQRVPMCAMFANWEFLWLLCYYILTHLLEDPSTSH